MASEIRRPGRMKGGGLVTHRVEEWDGYGLRQGKEAVPGWVGSGAMPRRFVPAPEVEELLGSRGVEQLTSTEMFTCSCGQRARMDDEPVSV